MRGAPARAASGRRAPHLVEVGVQWPPEDFLCRKLVGLARSGMRVTVASRLVRQGDFTLPGVELMPLPPPGSHASMAVRAALALALRSPRRLARLVWNVWRVSPALRRRHGGRAGLLSMCLPLARLRPDVVQFEWNIAAVDHLPLFGVWPCPIATSCRGSDLTVYPHVPGLEAYADRLPEVMRRASVVHCVSDALRRQASAYGLEPHKARVIRPAVDAAAFGPDGSERARSEPFKVLMVGATRWEKGHEYALQAIRVLADTAVPAELELIGGSAESAPLLAPEEQRIRHTIADLGLQSRVRLLGRLTAEEVGRRMAQADVLLHASLAEGIPNVVIEAMACGLPVVTSDCGAVREVVADGVEGCVVDPRRPDLLAGALLRLWRNPELRRRMGEAGRAKARADFALATQVQQFLDMYLEVIA